MRKFAEIWEIAAERKGGDGALEALLTQPKSAEELTKIPDDRWLSKASQMIFNAGFNWKVVETKWPGFEDAFWGFDLDKVAFMHGEDFDKLLGNTAIIRNAMKLHSVQENAVFFQELRAEAGGVGAYFAAQNPEHFNETLETLKKRGSRLGGNSGAYFLRMMGVDSYVMARDVVARLVAEGVVDKTPSSKTAMRQVQNAFNEWSAQSGRSLSEISRVLAFSV